MAAQERQEFLLPCFPNRFHRQHLCNAAFSKGSGRTVMNATPRVNTLFILMAQYGAVAVIPVEQVCRDYFSHLTPEKHLRKVKAGDIALPVVSLESSQKSAKGVGLQALAEYLDARMKEAYEDCRKLNGRIG